MERMNLAVKTAAAMLVVLLAVALINGCNEDNAPVTSPGVTQTTPDIDFNNPPKDARRGILPRSKTLADCPTDRYCGPMDVVFVIDVTGSMFGAIGNVKDDIVDILDCIETVSGNDYQLGLLTFKDDITVVHNLAASNKAAVAASIAGLGASGGAGEPEASDEAIKTVVQELAARSGQTGSFSGWRAYAKKVVVLVTDARPGGFNDTYDVGVDDANANEWAEEAAAKYIGISAIYCETYTMYSTTIEPIMQYYAATTGGVYHKTPSDGSGTGDAILGIVSSCGFFTLPAYMDIMPGGCPNPINTKSNGITPVAILGEAGFDVTDIDLSTVLLNGVPPTSWYNYDDVGTPYYGLLVDCYSCNSSGPDMYTDLKLKFSTPALVASLGTDPSGCIILELTGALNDGTLFKAKDIIKIVP